MAVKAPSSPEDGPMGSEWWEILVEPYVSQAIEHAAHPTSVSEWLDTEMTWRTVCPFYFDFDLTTPVQDEMVRSGDAEPKVDLTTTDAGLHVNTPSDDGIPNIVWPSPGPAPWRLRVTPSVRKKIERSAEAERLTIGEWLRREMRLRMMFPPIILKIRAESEMAEHEAWQRWEFRVGPRAREIIRQSAESENLSVEHWMSRELMAAGNKARLAQLAKEMCFIMPTGEDKADLLIKAANEWIISRNNRQR